MLNVYIASGLLENSDQQYDIPVIYWYLRDYYEKHGQNNDKINWCGQFISDPWEDIAAKLEENPPDVMGFSCYIWSRVYLYDLAAKVKTAYPDCKIIFGVPQTEYEFLDNFWEDHPFIDYVVPGQGEHTFQEFLDRCVDGTPEQTADILYYQNGQAVHNPPHTLAKTTTWDNNWVERFEDELAAEIAKKPRNANVLYETTRGCPYGCIYCDWGGGIYAKVKKKPLDVVEREVEIMARLHGDIILGNANWGLLPEDLDVTKMIVEAKKRHGWPSIVYFDVTKSKNIDRIEKIFEIFLEADLVPCGPRLALQDTDENVLKTIDRKNNHWTEQFTMAERLKEKYNIVFNVDMIFGLPGQTRQTWFESMSQLMQYGYFAKSNHVSILPNAPMAKKYYRDLYDIKHKFFHKTQCSYFHKARDKAAHDWLIQHDTYSNTSEVEDTTCLITSCYSFDEADLAWMHLMDNLLYSLNGVLVDIPYQIIKTLPEPDQLEICRRFFAAALYDAATSSSALGKKLALSVDQYIRYLKGEIKTEYIDIDPNWKILLTCTGAVRLWTFSHIGDVLNWMRSALAGYVSPELIEDCLHHQEMLWTGPDYTSGTTRRWTARDYPSSDFETTVSWTMCTTRAQYRAQDWRPIDWSRWKGYGRLESYYYQVCFGRYGRGLTVDYHKDNT